MPSPRRSSRPEPEMDTSWASAAEIARSRRGRQGLSALQVTEDALARIMARDPVLNAFTDVLAERARKRAQAIDDARAAKQPLGPARRRAVRGEEPVRRRRACRRARARRSTASLPRRAHDQPLIERLEAAGAVLVGALNMGEYAYDFTGENVHDGNAHNPHDTSRMTGGSSSGSGGAVAGGLVPLSLGSDTNGSIRVPSSFCGLFGLKPTYGRLSRARSFPFVASLDHLGPLARTPRDLALAYDAMQGPDAEDPVCADRPVEPTAPALARGTEGLRIAVAGGYFKKGMFPEACVAVQRVASALRRQHRDRNPRGAARARRRLRHHGERRREPASRPAAHARRTISIPAIRDRLIAGAMIPAALVMPRAEIPPLVSRRGAQAVRERRRDPRARDALHRAGDRAEDLRARRRRDCRCGPTSASTPSRSRSSACRSWPCRCRSTPMPIAVQIIAPPWREDIALRIAYALEQAGVCVAPRPAL